MGATTRKSRKSRRAAVQSTPVDRSNRSFLISTAAIAVAVLVVHVISSRPALSWMWGAHFYAFFNPAVLVVATLILGASILLLARGAKRIENRATDVLSPALAGRRMVVAASLAVVAGTVLFWVVRICHTYLGDGSVIVMQIDTMHPMLEREPLTSQWQYLVYGIAKPWFYSPDRPIEDVARDAVAVGSVAAGFLFLVASWFLADELSRLRPSTGSDNRQRPLVLLIWLCLVSQGYIQLFFGYVENYSPYAVGIVVFLWLCLRCLRGACALLLPALSLCLCFALHLSSSVLVVPFAGLAWAVLRSPARRRGAIRDLAIVAALVVVTELVLLRTGYNPLSTLLGMVRTAFAARYNSGYMFTQRHFRDFFNEQMLIGPLGMFLFLAGAFAAIVVARKQRGDVATFCLLAGGAFLVACWMIGDSNLGYARDWDLLSHSSIVFTTAGLGLFLSQRARVSGLVVALVIGVLTSAYHTVPWIATNARENQSLARLKTLPLGLGRTEVLVAEWYQREGDKEQQRTWLERAIVAYSLNVTAYARLGELDLEQKRYPSAIAALNQAASIRPDKTGYQMQLARAYMLAGREQEALPHLQTALNQQPGNVTIVVYFGEALYRAGRPEAERFFAHADSMCSRVLARRPRDGVVLAKYGWILFRRGKVEESLAVLSKAVAADPPSREGNCYLGYVLHSLGRDEEAQRHFRDCLAHDLELPTEIPDQEKIVAWLSASGARTR